MSNKFEKSSAPLGRQNMDLEAELNTLSYEES